MKIVLFSLIPETKFGGSAVQGAHLYRSFKQMGYEPILVRIGARTEHKSREYTHGVPYYNVSKADALGLAREHPSVITYIHWKTCGDICLELLRERVPIIVSDPQNFYPDLFTALSRDPEIPVIGIRRGNTKVMQESGIPQAQWIPHPFISARPKAPIEQAVNALCLSRVDFRKHQEIICRANYMMDEEKRVHMYGALNRMYAFHTLDKEFGEDWRRWYHGPFPTGWGTSQELLASAKFAVDLTVIKKSNDGDGSQYLFLEAWDTGVPLIVHRGWIRTGKDEVRDGETALAIDDAQSLADVLTNASDDQIAEVVAGGREQLHIHYPEQVVPQYLEVMRK